MHASLQHELPTRVLQQVVPQATSPAKVEQHWWVSLQTPVPCWQSAPG
jgi:hypothetical protein